MSTKTFLVLRLGHNVAASLDNKNAANIGGMASFILSALDKDIAFGDKLSLYEVTAELPFAGYIQYRGSSVQNRYLDGDVRAEHVGEMTIHTNAKWYSFPAGGKWKAHLKRTVDNAIHVLDAMVPERFPREKRIAMCGEVQIQQLLKHVFHEMHEEKNMKTTTKIVEALLGEGFGGSGKTVKLSPGDRSQINRGIYSATLNKYFNSLAAAIEVINHAMKPVGYFIMASSDYMGRDDGHKNLPIHKEHPEGTDPFMGHDEVSNCWLSFSWHKMGSGKYEITAYVS